jgi:hypothetical protein
MAWAYGKYEEIFGTHFHKTRKCLNCGGDRYLVAWVLYKSVYKREENRYLSSTCVCYLTDAQQMRHFVVFLNEILVK